MRLSPPWAGPARRPRRRPTGTGERRRKPPSPPRRPTGRSKHKRLLARPLDGIVVLAVDDNRDARDVVRLLLEPLGVRVHLAESGEHALEILKGMRPHIILLDILMPEMDG